MIADGPHETFSLELCRNEWLAEQTAGLLYRDNLIYLPFAAHLADEGEDEDEEAGRKAA